MLSNVIAATIQNVAHRLLTVKRRIQDAILTMPPSLGDGSNEMPPFQKGVTFAPSEIAQLIQTTVDFSTSSAKIGSMLSSDMYIATTIADKLDMAFKAVERDYENSRKKHFLLANCQGMREWPPSSLSAISVWHHINLQAFKDSGVESVEARLRDELIDAHLAEPLAQKLNINSNELAVNARNVRPRDRRSAITSMMSSTEYLCYDIAVTIARQLFMTKLHQMLLNQERVLYAGVWPGSITFEVLHMVPHLLEKRHHQIHEDVRQAVVAACQGIQVKQGIPLYADESFVDSMADLLQEWLADIVLDYEAFRMWEAKKKLNVGIRCEWPPASKEVQ